MDTQNKVNIDNTNQMSAKSSSIMIQCKGCDKYFNVDVPVSALLPQIEDRKKETHAVNEEYLCMSCTNLIMLPRALCGNLCEICGKIFSSHDRNLEGIIADLTLHIAAHSQDTLYRCVYCGRVFLRSLYLEVHHRIHTGSKPHVCHLCSDKFITLYLLHKHRQEKHAIGERMMPQVGEILKEEEEEEEEEEEDEEENEDECLQAMVPEIKMEVISDEEVEIEERIPVKPPDCEDYNQVEPDINNNNQLRMDINNNFQLKVEMGDNNNQIKIEVVEHKRTDVNKEDNPGHVDYGRNNPSAQSLLSAIQGHHNISSSYSIPEAQTCASSIPPSFMFINAPEHFLTPHTSHPSSVQNRPAQLPLQLVLPLNNIAMQRHHTEAGSSSRSTLGNVSVPSIPTLTHCLMQPLSNIQNQTFPSSVPKHPIVPEFSIYPNLLVQYLSKAKLDRQQLYIKQIESLEEIDFLELRPEDVTIGLVFVIHEKKRANKLELTWEGVAEYFRNIFQMSNLNGRQLSRSFISVVKRYELKKSQNSLEDYATCRYYPPAYNDNNIAFARILSRYGLDICNISTMMLTNEYILKIFNFLQSGNFENSLWIYIYQCISKILNWRGPEQIIINSIIDVGNKYNKLLTDNNYNQLIVYLNQLFKPTNLTYQNTQSENIKEIDCVNYGFIKTNFEIENGIKIVDSEVELKGKCNIFPFKPILTDNKRSSLEHLNESATAEDLDKSSISVKNFRSYLSQEIEKQYTGIQEQKKSKINELTKSPKFVREIKEKDNVNEYESIESLLISGEENETTESFNSKPTIEEYLKLYNDNDAHTYSNVKCKQIKDMIFTSDKRLNQDMLLKDQIRTDSIAVDWQTCNKVEDNQIPNGSKITKEDELSDIKSYICKAKQNLESKTKMNTYKRKNDVDETRIIKSEVKKQKLKSSEEENHLSLKIISKTENQGKKMVKGNNINENLTRYEFFNSIKAPNLTEKNFTNFVACKMYEKMISSTYLKDIFLPDLTKSVENIFGLINLMQQDVFYSFQQIFETSKELSSDNLKLNQFLRSLYKPPHKEFYTDPDNEILRKLNELIAYNIEQTNSTSINAKYNTTFNNNYNCNYDNNNENIFFVEPDSLLPVLYNVKAKHFTNRIVYDIYKESTRLSYEMKIKFWAEMRATFARIVGINNINIYNVCQKFSRVHSKALSLQNNSLRFDSYLSSTFKCNMNICNKNISRQNYDNNNNNINNNNNNNNLEKVDHRKQSRYLKAKSLNTESLSLSDSNTDVMLPQNQGEQSESENDGIIFLQNKGKESEPETLLTDTLLEDVSNPVQNQVKESETETLLTDTLLEDDSNPVQNQVLESEAINLHDDSLSEDDSNLVQNHVVDSEDETFDNDALSENDSNPIQNHVLESGSETVYNDPSSEEDSGTFQNQVVVLRADTFHNNTQENDSNPKAKNFLSSKAVTLKPETSVDDSDSVDQDITHGSNSNKIQRQHQEMLDIFGLEELTEETFINGVAWKIFKEMKTRKEDLLPSWEKVAIFVRNIFQNRNIIQDSLKENFEEIFTYCQLLKAKKELRTLKNYFNSLYTFPTQKRL